MGNGADSSGGSSNNGADPNSSPHRKTRPTLSTRSLGAAVVAVAGTGLAIPATAEAYLNNRHEYFPARSNSTANSYECAIPGNRHNGPQRSPSEISNYARVIHGCSPGDPNAPSGYAHIVIWSDPTHPHPLTYSSAHTAGMAVRLHSISIPLHHPHTIVWDECSNDPVGGPSNKSEQCVSRRSFNSY